ncbi:uncharacterized protein BO66DRAFT_89195 [Aspergillus aculeatinus CBS 121060]|uniref:Uncharacterized protein n=1 Tax=Aspergillus aculeatinus CBS 121060 TaxID=1448322 RepID=A0ACD1H984_9EURO|nr:hypothetical protein BO66DRAFT_89195 [Aspergillus aculeatinus CBS 121060]RAH70142.1 hypothetical protein BO66DRAFT_89195 [Aspergillus aculeatinus CBS 121060]
MGTWFWFPTFSLSLLVLMEGEEGRRRDWERLGQSPAISSTQHSVQPDKSEPVKSSCKKVLSVSISTHVACRPVWVVVKTRSVLSPHRFHLPYLDSQDKRRHRPYRQEV